jgi:hypothetical protein
MNQETIETKLLRWHVPNNWKIRAAGEGGNYCHELVTGEPVK